MTKAGARLIEAAKEAVAIAKGEQPAARIHVNGFARPYVSNAPNRRPVVRALVGLCLFLCYAMEAQCSVIDVNENFRRVSASHILMVPFPSPADEFEPFGLAAIKHICPFNFADDLDPIPHPNVLNNVDGPWMVDSLRIKFYGECCSALRRDAGSYAFPKVNLNPVGSKKAEVPSTSLLADVGFEFPVKLDTAGWRLALIGNSQTRRAVPLGVHVAPIVPDGEVSSNLRLANAAIDLVALTRLKQGLRYEQQAQQPDDSSSGGYYDHGKGPLSHVPLGVKVGLGALLLMAGLYYAGYAFSGRGGGAGTRYLLLGVVSVVAGLYFCLHGMTSV